MAMEDELLAEEAQSGPLRVLYNILIDSVQTNRFGSYSSSTVKATNEPQHDEGSRFGRSRQDNIGHECV